MERQAAIGAQRGVQRYGLALGSMRQRPPRSRRGQRIEQRGMSRQLVGRSRCSGARQIPWMGHEDVAARPDPLRDEPRVGERSDAQSQVEAPLDEVEHAVVEHEIDADLGVGGGELGERGHHVQEAE